MPIFIEFVDRHSINEADAEVPAVAEANTTPLSEAECKVQDVLPDEAQPNSGVVELSMGLVQDTQTVLQKKHMMQVCRCFQHFFRSWMFRSWKPGACGIYVTHLMTLWCLPNAVLWLQCKSKFIRRVVLQILVIHAVCNR